MTLDVNLGQIIEAAAFVGTVVWAHSQMASKIDVFLDQLREHKDLLNEHGQRLNNHGERIARVEIVRGG